MALVGVVATAVWAMLPAYIPNNVAVLVGGGPPLDFGRSVRGRRILGDGKTWRGTLGGIAAGIVVAGVLAELQPSAVAITGVTLPTFPIGPTVALPVGAMGGDIVASLCKRRLGRRSGSPVPVVDQLDFVAGALVVAAIVAPEWTADTFTVPVLAVVVVLTPLLHLGTNGAAYLLGLKDQPW